MGVLDLALTVNLTMINALTDIARTGTEPDKFHAWAALHHLRAISPNKRLAAIGCTVPFALLERQVMRDAQDP